MIIGIANLIIIVLLLPNCVQGAVDPLCDPLLTGIACNGHGVCNGNPKSCSCTGGWSGPFCGTAPGEMSFFYFFSLYLYTFCIIRCDYYNYYNIDYDDDNNHHINSINSCVIIKL